jgi:hypothetical protein
MAGASCVEFFTHKIGQANISRKPTGTTRKAGNATSSDGKTGLRLCRKSGKECSFKQPMEFAA